MPKPTPLSLLLNNRTSAPVLVACRVTTTTAVFTNHLRLEEQR